VDGAKTPASSVSALFLPKLGEKEVGVLLADLERNGVFVVDGSKVIYSLPV
jgi:hypothetical protein